MCLFFTVLFHISKCARCTYSPIRGSYIRTIKYRIHYFISPHHITHSYSGTLHSNTRSWPEILQLHIQFGANYSATIHLNEHKFTSCLRLCISAKSLLWQWHFFCHFLCVSFLWLTLFNLRIIDQKFAFITHSQNICKFEAFVGITECAMHLSFEHRLAAIGDGFGLAL